MKLQLKESDYLIIRSLITNSKTQIPLNEKLKLEEEIQKSRIIKDRNFPSDVVCLGCRVEILDLNSMIKNTLIIVLPEEARIKEQKISLFAPLAIALLGEKEGQIIQWKVQRGTLRLKIIKVEQAVD